MRKKPGHQSSPATYSNTSCSGGSNTEQVVLLSYRVTVRTLFHSSCAVGRNRTSLMSTSAGCSMANAIARATASAGIAIRR